MSLWYNCSSAGEEAGWSRARFARHDLGMDVVLCAPGPSMEVIPRQTGVMIAALTKAYPRIIPDIWFGMDTVECYDRRIWAEPFMKVCRAGDAYQNMTVRTASGDRPVRTFPNTYFADVHDGLGVADIFRSRGHDTAFVWFKHTLAVAFHVLVWMGARRFFLNGFDLRDVAGRDYATGVNKSLTPTLRKSNARLFAQQVDFIRELNSYAKRNGVEIFSSTLESPINAFLPYRSLTGSMGLLHQIARENVPLPEQLLHSFETPIGIAALKHQALRIQRARVTADRLPFNRDGLKASLARASKKRAMSNRAIAPNSPIDISPETMAMMSQHFISSNPIPKFF